MTDMQEINSELEAMTKIAEALGGKDEKTCLRILDWAASIFTKAVLMDGCVRGRDFSMKNRATEND